MNLTEQIEFLRGQLGVRWPRQWRKALWTVMPEELRWKIGKVGASAHRATQETYLDRIERYCAEVAIRRLDPPNKFQQLFDDRIEAVARDACSMPKIIGKKINQIITDEFPGAPNADDPNEDA